MADEVVFNVKSNLQQVAADTKEWESSLKGAAKEVEELTEDVKVQNSVLLDMDKELISTKGSHKRRKKWFKRFKNTIEKCER